MQTAGFVLVGGLSRRMGRDKALLTVESRYLVEDVAAKVCAAAGNVALVGRPGDYGSFGIECLPDLRPGLGPLGGIETALHSQRGEFNLILACDMPGIDVPFLSALLAEAERTGRLCVVTRDCSGLIHPLCAVYRSGCQPHVRDALNAGRLKLHDLVRELDGSIFEIGTNLSNINTPQDWAAWQERRPA
jgi:molybdopterin-guanine dinucleotide biosynthesis protein A